MLQFCETLCSGEREEKGLCGGVHLTIVKEFQGNFAALGGQSLHIVDQIFSLL